MFDIFTKKKKLERPIVLERSTINETYGALSIKEVKRILLDENFSELNALYFLMLSRDLHLAGEINKRKMQLLTTEYTVEGSDTAKKFCETFLKNFSFSSFLHELSSAIPYGFSFIDLVWDVRTLEGKSYFVPISHKQLSQRFVYANNEEERYLTDTLEHLYIKQQQQKVFIGDFDPRKLLSHIHKTDTGYITDFVLLNKAAWFVALKHAVIASNMQYYEALGTPPLIIHHDSDDKEELQFLLSQALGLRSNGVGIFPKESTAALLKGEGSRADFLSFVGYVDSAISQYVLGNTLAGGDAAKGTYGTAKIHAEIKKEYLVFDAKLIAATITRFLNLVLSQNFTGEEVSFSFVIEDEEDQKELSETYLNLTQAGYEIPIEHIEKKFRIKGVTKKAAMETEKNFSVETNAKIPLKPLDHIDAEFVKFNNKEAEEALVGALIGFLQEAESYQEAYDMLVEKYPDLDTDTLESSLQALIANAYIQGAVDADTDQF